MIRVSRRLLVGWIVIQSCVTAKVQAMHLGELLAAWESRSNVSRVVQYRWSETRTTRTKALPRISIFSPAFVVHEPFASEVLTHQLDFQLQVTREHYWYQRIGVRWDPDTSRFLHQAFDTYQDGQLDQNVYRTPDKTVILPELAPSVAFLHSGEYAFSYFEGPPILHHCPLRTDIGGLDRELLQLTSRKAVVAGHDCMMLRYGREIYWVDPGLDYLIRRYESPGRYRVDIDYQEHSVVGWVLSGWRIAKKHEPGQPFETESVAQVSMVALNGEPFPTKMVKDIPVGTDVQDRRRGSDKRYFLLEGGRKREVTREDTRYGSPTYEEFVNSVSGEAMPKHFIEISERMKSIATADNTERDKLLSELREYCASHRTLQRHVELSQRTARRLARSANPSAAVRMCREFALISDIYRRSLLPLADGFSGDIRRQELLINGQLKISGTKVDGEPFDWNAYRGKVVLVDFWYTGCVPCIEQMPRIVALYERYKDKGFEVVGVSSDANRDQLTSYLAKANIPWETIHEPPGTPDSNNARYNVTAFPTTILVGRDGVVLSLEATADELEPLLREHL